MIYSKVFPSSDRIASSVLNRKWKSACFYSWIVFLLYEILMCIQSYTAAEPLCAILPEKIGSPFYFFACAAALSGFFFTFAMLSVRISQMVPGKERVPSIIALDIVFKGLLSTLIFVIYNWNGICIDVLGVGTPAILWGEWFCSSPMLVFLTITLNGKNYLNKTDKIIMVSFFLCILFGFLPIIPQPQYLGYLWVAFASIFCIPVLLLPWYVLTLDHEPAADIEKGDKEDQNGWLKVKNQSRQFYVALWLAISCPLFPLNYILVATKVIGPGDSVGVFLLLTLLMKAFYAASVADVHTYTLMDVQKDEERRERDRNLLDLEKERYANESRRVFFKYLFHEVRTPLNSLSMGVDLLKTLPVLSPADLELLDMMGGAADFMTETLNNILSMQKIEEGKMEMTFSPFSISHSITKIFSAMSGAAIAKSLRIEKHIAAEVPALLVGDVYRVEHVISNLLSNAIKFSPTNGAIRVTVSAAAAPYTESHLTSITVAVSDEGPGISAENQDKLFGGFFQVRPDQLQQGKGSGLGLALCKEIVTLHGGTIGVDSVEGQGSTFHFRIQFGVPNRVSFTSKHSDEEDVKLPQTTSLAWPVRESTITAPMFTDISLFESSEAHGPQFSPSILVVDDVASNRKILQALLNNNGAKDVDTAENGQEAVEAALANPQKYDIIFMDNLMPVMNGVEAVRRLREEGYAKLVVGVTGNILDDDVIEYLSAGVDMVMGKPVKLVLLKKLLEYVKKVHGNVSRPGMYLSEEEISGLLTWRRK